MNDSDILLTLKKENLDTGLRGIPVGHCSTSLVDPQKGLFYKGYSISMLADKSPEEVIYLLLEGELPTSDELAAFNAKLNEYGRLDPKVLVALKAFPKSAHPMRLFMAGLNLAGICHESDDLRVSSMHVIGKITEITAWVYRLRSEWGEIIPSEPERGYIENFIHMLSPPGVDLDKLTKLMRVFAILHLDHGGGNLSTFAGKVVASSGADLYESLIAAMAGLAGPLHGKANQESLRFLKRAETSISDPRSESEVEAFIRACMDKGEKIFGFGHAVLRVEDPRATIQYALGDELVPSDSTFILAQTFRRVGPRVLSGIKKIANPYTNVDAVSGCLLSAMGLRDESFYTVLFGMARCIGITAQILYERLEARNGRGTPIVRPKYIYNGPVRS